MEQQVSSVISKSNNQKIKKTSSKQAKNKFFRLKILYILLSITPISIALPEAVFISLGNDCEAAGRLRQFHLRESAFPFDWMGTPDFDGVCKIIENKFINFLNPSFLKHVGKGISNTYYNVCFRHDFPTLTDAGAHFEIPYEGDIADNFLYQGIIVDNFLDYLESITRKHAKRINRFLSSLNNSRKIIFIRTHATPDEAKKFVKMMKKNYPSANYLLVIVHNDITLNFQWHIPQVESFYVSEKHPNQIANANGWVHPNEWQNIFMQLGVIQA